MTITLTNKTTEFSSGVTGAIPLHSDSATSYLYPLVVPVPGELGGCTVYHLAAAASKNPVVVKAAAGQVYGFNITHVDATPVYVTFYDVATAPTVDTTTIKMKFGAPYNSGNATAADGSEKTVNFPMGMVFSTGISIAVHSGIATSGDLTANEVLFTMWYK